MIGAMMPSAVIMVPAGLCFAISAKLALLRSSSVTGGGGFATSESLGDLLFFFLSGSYTGYVCFRPAIEIRAWAH